MGAFVVSANLEGGPPLPIDLARVRPWLLPDRDGFDEGAAGALAWVRSRFYATPEDRPLAESAGAAAGDRAVCLADARLDNRDDLLVALGLERDVPESAVIAAAYWRWGTECCAHLQGDFAFVVWDPAKRRLLAATDPCHVKAVRFWARGPYVVAGSRTRAVAQCLPTSPDFNASAFSNYLAGDASIWNCATSFEDVGVVPAGYRLLVEGTQVRCEPFRRLGNRAEFRSHHFEEYVEAFRELLTRAVIRRMRAPGPVAVTLSGGLDSSSVAAVAADAVRKGRCPGPLPAVSLVFPDTPEADESEFQQAVLKAWPELQGLPVSAEPLWAYRRFLETPEANRPDEIESGAEHRWVRHAFAQEAAKAGARVLLVGLMADHLVGATTGAAVLADGTWPQRLREWQRLCRVRNPWWGTAHLLRSAVIQTPRLMAALGPHRRPRLSTLGNTQAYVGVYAGASVLRRSVASDNAAHAGLEIRDPFLDEDLVEFLLSLPSWVRLRVVGPKAKSLLRSAMSGFLPEPVRLRSRRTTFNVIFERGRIREEATLRALLQDSEALARGWVPRARYEALSRTLEPADDLRRLVEVELRLKRHLSGGVT